LSIYPPVRDELTRLLSQPRLTKYKQAVPGGKLGGALELYVWNLAISGAFFESLHYFEVGLRNTMDEELAKWATSKLGAADPWYRDQAVPLDNESRNHVRLAIKRVTDNGKRAELHGGVVAELTFGFWWSLLADHYNRTLWQPCLQYAFTNVRRRRLHDKLDHLRELRNRIAHHEPLHGRDLVDDYTTMLDTAERFSPRLAWWIDNTSRVPQLLSQRP
jgi:hypothetical protein